MVMLVKVLLSENEGLHALYRVFTDEEKELLRTTLGERTH